MSIRLVLLLLLLLVRADISVPVVGLRGVVARVALPVILIKQILEANVAKCPWQIDSFQALKALKLGATLASCNYSHTVARGVGQLVTRCTTSAASVTRSELNDVVPQRKYETCNS